MYHHNLNGQDKNGNQGTKVALYIDDFNIKIFPTKRQRRHMREIQESRLDFSYKTTLLTFQVNR